MDKILVVDDDMLFLEALKRGLKKYETQFQSFFALNADAAIEIMKDTQIAVLVTDISMPGRGGIDLFAFKDQFYPRTQCIIMTGYGTDDLKHSARMDDAFCYFEKPFQISELGRAVIRALESRDEGRLVNPILLSTLIKLIQAKKETCILEVDRIGGGKGILYFINGAVSGAECGDWDGNDAAREILTWNRVNFRFQQVTKEKMQNRIKNLISCLDLDALCPDENPGMRNEDKSDFDFDDMLQETLENILENEFESEDAQNDETNDTRVDAPANELVSAIVDPAEEYAIKKQHAKILRLLIVDDSKMMRKVIADIFRSDDGIRIVGECENGKEALEVIQRTKVDVMTLDVEMPVMDGLTTLKHLMIKHPVPAVMVSSLTREGASATFDALKFGAVDFVAKPSRLSLTDMEKQSSEIIRKVRLAADVEIRSVHLIRGSKNSRNNNDSELSGQPLKCRRIFTLGAGEGGYGALLKILPRLPKQFQGTCLVMLHAESKHVDAFVSYLKPYCDIHIKRAANAEILQGGYCYFASGEEYLTIEELNDYFLLRVSPAPAFRNRSNINIMMFSAAEMMHRHTTGLILSGSGTDGCEGMEEIKRVGGKTLVQTPGSCIYKEMAESVIHKFNVHRILPDNEIALEMLKDLA